MQPYDQGPPPQYPPQDKVYGQPPPPPTHSFGVAQPGQGHPGYGPPPPQGYGYPPPDQGHSGYGQPGYGQPGYGQPHHQGGMLNKYNADWFAMQIFPRDFFGVIYTWMSIYLFGLSSLDKNAMFCDRNITNFLTSLLNLLCTSLFLASTKYSF